jgi:parvulin-like peptidyl-prolyl isomerase
MFPHAERLKYNRDVYLYQAMIGFKDLDVSVSYDDQLKYYNEHQKEFSEAKVRLIYVAFSNNPAPTDNPKAKKYPTEAEAEKKAAELAKKIRAGADFVKLAKEETDDPAGKETGGEYPNIKPDDNTVPGPIRTAVFSLKPGEITDPLKQANGFYIVRLEKFEVPEFPKVKDDIFRKLKGLGVHDWLETVKKDVKVEFKDEKYLSEKTPRN